MSLTRLLMAAALAAAALAAASSAASPPPGYPRYTTSGHLTRLSTAATIRDDFNASAIDLKRWRVWTSDPGRVRMQQKDGRFWIDVTGPAGYNGLVSRVEMPTRDVELVCRAGIASQPQAKHVALIHLCGSGPLSPDHWIEVQLRDSEGHVGNATVNLAVPPEHRAGYRGGYELHGSPEAGYLFRLVCEGATNLCRGFVRAEADAWWQLGDGFEVPARSTRLEIKTTGLAEEGASSHIWFDDCRVYPRPQTHYVTVVLKRPDGSPPGVRDKTAEAHQVCLDPDNVEVPDCDLTVRLYDADGQRLIDEAHAGTGFGYALLKLASGWEIYPVPAIIRVYANGHQLGADQVIQSSGVDGLYPDDVYAITLN